MGEPKKKHVVKPGTLIPCISIIFRAFVVMMLFMSNWCNPDLNKDREKCADKLVGLAGCLPYVGGEAQSPTTECCSGLKLVVQNSGECLCLLIKDRNDPNLGLKINTTLALSLPQKCHAPANVSQCPALLHLAPNSPDAKVFDDFAKSGEASNTSSPAQGEGSSSSTGGKGPSAATIKSDGGKGKRGLRLEETILGMLLICASLRCFDPLLISIE